MTPFLRAALPLERREALVGIPLENIKPGMGLIVLRGPQVRSPIGAYGIETEFLEDRTWQGCLLVALSVSAPYVACRIYWPTSLAGARDKAKP